MREGYGPQGGSKRSRITEHHIVKRQPPSMYAWLWNENALQGIDQLAPFAHPTVRKIIVTGSVEVGKQLAALAGRHMKRTTMELGGHTPCLCSTMPMQRPRPARLRPRSCAMLFRTAFRSRASSSRGHSRPLPLRTGFGFRDGEGRGWTERWHPEGPLWHAGHVPATEKLVADARKRHRSADRGKRIGNVGSFYAPTIVHTPDDRIALMRKEPFGSVAVVFPFRDIEDGLARANGLPFGLVSYIFSNSLERTDMAAAALQAGMVSIKHFGLALPVSPFGGVRDSGHGSERGTGSIHPGVRPSRALHRSRTPRWRRARAPVPGLRVSSRRVESFQPGRSPGSRSAPRRDRAHANPGAQAGAGSPACASSLLPPPHGHAAVMAAPWKRSCPARPGQDSTERPSKIVLYGHIECSRLPGGRGINSPLIEVGWRPRVKFGAELRGNGAK